MRASVIVPTLDRGSLVIDAVQSALDSGVADEVVVVDCGSTDGSLDELRRFGDRIRLVEGAFASAAAARNAGAAAAYGRLLAFLDSDDLMLPEKVTCLAPILEADESVALAHGSTSVINAEGLTDLAATREQNRQLEEGARRGTSYDALAEYCAMYTSATLVRRAAFETIGGYDESLEVYEDWDLYLRLARQFRLVYSPCVTARYRLWPGNVPWDRTAAGVATVARKHLAGNPEHAARYALLRRLATASHILLQGQLTRHAAFAAIRLDPVRGLRDPQVRGLFVRSLIPSAALRRRRPRE